MPAALNTQFCPADLLVMAGRDCEARTRFSAPPATARGEVSLRLRRAALRVRSHSGCAAWWARTARRVSSKPGAQHGGRAAAACNQSCARVAGPGARSGQPGEGSVTVSLWPGGRQGTNYRRGPSARVPARVSGRAGGRGSTAGVGAEDARVPAWGGTAATGGAQHSGRAAR